MANVLLAHQGYGVGDDLKWFFEDKGHSVMWYRHRDQVRKLYDNVPEYDIAIVDKCVTGAIEGKNPMVIDCDDLVKKLKQVHPDKKVLCLTHVRDPCEYADKNIFGMTREVLENLFREVELATTKQ